MVSVENLQWAAGFFDGDGCVFVGRTNTLYVIVNQAVTYKANVEELVRLFGGRVRANTFRSKPNENQQVNWTLCGKKAVAFCKQIEPHALLKRPQILLGAAHRVEDKIGAGETIREMKKRVHAQVTAQLSPAYTAGFLDADGCLAITTGIAISAVQKYPAILYALAEVYKGSVAQETRAKAGWHWNVYGDSARHCLRETLPFFVGKRPQAELLATLNRENRLEVKAKITALKMRKKGVPVEEELKADFSPPELKMCCFPDSSPLRSG